MDLGNLQAPPAGRARTPGWRDPRLWVGIVIVAACVVAGARVMASADDRVAVWAAADDLVAGQSVEAGDLRAVHVGFRDAGDLDRYLRADRPALDALVLDRPLGSGELVPAASLGDGEQAEVLRLPLPVEAERVPPSVAEGSTVDVWASAGRGAGAQDGDGAEAEAGLLLEGVRVVGIGAGDASLGGTGVRQLVLAVPPQQDAAVARLLAASREGVVTVVERGSAG